MRCQYCNANWMENDQKFYAFCPFCRKPLIKMTEQISSLKEGLAYLTGEYGKEVLGDRQTVLLFIDTFLPKAKRERNFLNMAYASGIVRLISESKDDNAEKQKLVIQQSMNRLIDAFGISEEWASYVIGCLAMSLGLAVSVHNLTIQRKLDAEKGDVNAQFSLALEYLDKEDMENYGQWMRKAIKNGSVQAAFHYGKYLFDNATENREGEELLMGAANAGNRDAVCYAAHHLSELTEEHQEKIREFVEQMQVMDASLSSKQLLELSFYYEQQDKLPQAITVCEKAYKKEALTSWKRYIALLEKRSAPLDHVTVGKVYRQLLEIGNLEAIEKLAEYVKDKAISEEDKKTVIYWYKVAANAGSVRAQRYLENIYDSGSI